MVRERDKTEQRLGGGETDLLVEQQGGGGEQGEAHVRGKRKGKQKRKEMEPKSDDVDRDFLSTNAYRDSTFSSFTLALAHSFKSDPAFSRAQRISLSVLREVPSNFAAMRARHLRLQPAPFFQRSQGGVQLGQATSGARDRVGLRTFRNLGALRGEDGGDGRNRWRCFGWRS